MPSLDNEGEIIGRLRLGGLTGKLTVGLIRMS